MIRGLLLGTSWGALLAIVAVGTLSLVYSKDGAPLEADQQAVIEAPEADDLEATAPSNDPVALATQESEPVPDPETSMPESDTAQEAMPSDAQPEMAQTETAPTTPAPEMTTTPAEASTAPKVLSELPDVATPTAQPEATAPTPDVQVVEMPKPTAPAQPQAPDVGARMPQIEPAPEAPAKTPDASEASEPKNDGLFDTARVSVPKMANLAPEVKTNRLPSIGAKPEVATEEIAPAADLGALTAHAMTFENLDAKPMFSVVLIDDPQSPIADDILSNLPFAVSFAIDAVREDASEIAARYRAAGFEVLMLTNLPSGASAADIEVAFGAYTRAIPEAIGVLDLGGNGFLRGPSTATQIAGIMSEHGFGLVTPSKGLNSAQKAASREGVPAALLFRELDEDGENPSVIRRYLDRAAFRAAQEGSVIMLGHTRPDTIEALVTWALEDRAASVAIAPVSAVLLAQ